MIIVAVSHSCLCHWESTSTRSMIYSNGGCTSVTTAEQGICKWVVRGAVMHSGRGCCQSTNAPSCWYKPLSHSPALASFNYLFCFNCLAANTEWNNEWRCRNSLVVWRMRVAIRRDWKLSLVVRGLCSLEGTKIASLAVTCFLVAFGFGTMS